MCRAFSFSKFYSSAKSRSDSDSIAFSTAPSVLISVIISLEQPTNVTTASKKIVDPARKCLILILFFCQ